MTRLTDEIKESFDAMTVCYGLLMWAIGVTFGLRLAGRYILSWEIQNSIRMEVVPAWVGTIQSWSYYAMALAAVLTAALLWLDYQEVRSTEANDD
jgi:hypothetical protein